MIKRSRRSPDEERSPDDWFAGVDERGDWNADSNDEWRSRSSGETAWGSADYEEPASDPYDDGWEDDYGRASAPRERVREPLDPLVRRRRLIALAAAFALAVIGIAIPVALLGGGGETAAPPPVVPQTIDETPTIPTITEPVITPTTPAVDLPSVDLSEVGTLRLGDRGDAVEQLQLALIALELDPGEADGVFGQKTRDAVVAFQEANGLEADGIVGESTAQAINDALAGS